MTSDELARFHAGDPSFFRRLVDDLSPRLLAVTCSFAADHAEAEDLLQKVWLRAYDRRSTFRGGGSLVGWMLVLCRHVCLDEARRAGVRHAASTVPWVEGEHRSHQDSPGSAMERAARGRAVRTAILELPDRQRETVVLRMLEGRTIRETADILGCAEGTVKAALHHALTKLRPLLLEWKP